MIKFAYQDFLDDGLVHEARVKGTSFTSKPRATTLTVLPTNPYQTKPPQLFGDKEYS